MTKKRTEKPLAKAYEPTPAEAAAIETVYAKAKARTRAPNLKMDFDEKRRMLSVDFDHLDSLTARRLFMLDMNTGDPRFFEGLMRQVAALSEVGNSHSAEEADSVLSVVRAMEPRDELEAMLAAQMAAVHQATMAMARRLNTATSLPQRDAAERGLTKLARTYTTQMEALKRYRSKGQQVVRVERVTVEEGGQAIVGAVETGGRGDERK